MVSPRSAVASDVLSRPGANAREATLVLRDLAAQMPRLHGAEERQARSILARPTDGAADAYGNGYSGKSKRACGNNVCVHWALSGADAPPGAGTAGTPSWVQTTLKTFQNAWQQEIGVLGYRAPKGDLSSRNDGGNRKLDIYLADIGGRGLYGYCTSDDPHIPRYTGADGRRHYDMSAYCVVDDDFATSQFPENTRLENLRVTAAHEFFHAAQFAYDWLEDIWFMEGTATWMEDAVYDGIDDNYQFLRTSALTRPGVPLDLGGKGYEYGSWLFFRHLSETYGARIIRRAWKLAGSAHGDLDRHSTRALAGALSEVGATTQAAFSSFAQATTTRRRPTKRACRTSPTSAEHIRPAPRCPCWSRAPARGCGRSR
ncbi:MAG TPA: MXAN_6640 family putative metalloprotease [Actinomycetota bacterium]|jgi:hypothetical protein|nr:MXAN_6640 family putative metalloprotease [Actinomycetota bacterium]